MPCTSRAGLGSFVLAVGVATAGCGRSNVYFAGPPAPSTAASSAGSTTGPPGTSAATSGGSSSGASSAASGGGSSTGGSSTGRASNSSTGGSSSGGCAALAAGGTLVVNGDTGDDAAFCCGAQGHDPCQTIGYVMRVIDAAGAPNVNIFAVVGNDAGVWTPNAEAYPIVLGWGAELNAAGVSFVGRLFEIEAYSSKDTIGYASIVGAYGNPVTISENLNTSVQIESSSTLFIANGSVSAYTTAITVTADAGLTLGQDHSGRVTGTVTIGPEGVTGIGCTSANGLGCTITDATLTGQSSVMILGQSYASIDAEAYASISLSSAPVLNGAIGSFDDCQLSGIGLLLDGAARVVFRNGTAECHGKAGFSLQATSDEGLPQLTVDNTTIQNDGTGVYAVAGSAVVSNSMILHNGLGVGQDTDGTNVAHIDMSGGDAGGLNTIVCNNAATPAVDVLNLTTSDLDADNVEWDTPGPDVFQCDLQVMNCTCQLSGCVGQFGMDVVYGSTGKITTAGNRLSSVDCSSQ